MKKKRGTGIYFHGQRYKSSVSTSETNPIPSSVVDDFRYDAETGKLFWADPYIRRKDGVRRRRSHGGEAGTTKYRECGKVGTRSVNYKDREYKVHRIIYYIVKGYCPPLLDHIDRNPLNNRIENLRPSDPALNSWNSKVYANNTSGVGGVTWNKATQSWRARITVKGLVHELGFTDDFFEAACLRKSAELNMYGEYRRDS